MLSFAEATGLLLSGPVTLASQAVPSAYDCPYWPSDDLSSWLFSFENTPYVVTTIIMMLVFLSHDIIIPFVSLMVMVDSYLVNPLLVYLFRQFGPQGPTCQVYGYVMPEAITQRYTVIIVLGLLVGMRQKAIPSTFSLLTMSGLSWVIYAQAVYKLKAQPHQVIAAVFAGTASTILQLALVTKFLRRFGDAVVRFFPVEFFFGYHNEYVKDPECNFTAALGRKVPAYLGGMG